MLQADPTCLFEGSLTEQRIVFLPIEMTFGKSYDSPLKRTNVTEVARDMTRSSEVKIFR